MGFIESYKHLEKLCGELLNDDRRISAYIDEMINLPQGSYLVTGWDDDLKQLKHYRWIRNKIAHEPDCSEQNMCEPGDTEWLDDFYSRIMNQADPLALYAKAIAPNEAKNATQAQTPEHETDSYSKQVMNSKKSSRKAIGFTILLVVIAFIATVGFVLSKFG